MVFVAPFELLKRCFVVAFALSRRKHTKRARSSLSSIVSSFCFSCSQRVFFSFSHFLFSFSLALLIHVYSHKVLNVQWFSSTCVYRFHVLESNINIKDNKNCYMKWIDNSTAVEMCSSFSIGIFGIHFEFVHIVVECYTSVFCLICIEKCL